MVVSGRMESHRVKEQSRTIKVINECFDGPGISGSKGHHLFAHCMERNASAGCCCKYYRNAISCGVILFDQQKACGSV